MKPNISVVMCCYNSEKYVAQAIKSILTQSYTNFEFIIWNDGSTDGTEQIVKSFEDDRIRYFYHENTGLGMALRLACEQVKGDFIARMDADDIALPNRFILEYEYLQKHKNVVLVSSAVNYIDENGIRTSQSFPYTCYRIIEDIMNRGGNVIVHPSSMFRVDTYNNVGGYFPLKKAQDSLLFSKMMKYGRLAIISEPLLNYRVTDTSISSQTENRLYDQLIILLRRKMIADDIVLEEDVKVYNDLVNCARIQKRSNVLQTTVKRLKPSKEMLLYQFLLVFLSPKNSREFIIYIKNILWLVSHRF